MYVEEMFFTRTTNRKRYRKISLFQPLSIVYKLLYIKSIIGVYLLPSVQILQFPVFINQFCMENIGVIGDYILVLLIASASITAQNKLFFVLNLTLYLSAAIPTITAIKLPIQEKHYITS